MVTRHRMVAGALVVAVLLVFTAGILLAKDTLKSALYVNDAVTLFNNKEYEKSLRLCDTALQYDPDNGFAHLYRGINLYYLKQYDAALESLQKAVDLVPDKKNVYLWIAAVYSARGDNENYQRYSEMAEHGDTIRERVLPLEEIHDPYHEEALAALNHYQAILGNPPVNLDNRLNNAAKAHALYLIANHFREPITTNFHYEEKGREGFVGIDPMAQAQAFGFVPSPGYFVGNTMICWDPLYADAAYLINHLAATLYHRSMVIAPGFEAVGFYRTEKKGSAIVVYVYSHNAYPAQPLYLRYPARGQAEVPLAMLPEIPHPFPGDESVGFPVTVQYFGAARQSGGIFIEKAILRTATGKDVDIYRLDGRSPGDGGAMMRTFTMAAIAAKDPLAANTTYSVAMKVVDGKGAVVFDYKWEFTTGGK